MSLSEGNWSNSCLNEYSNSSIKLGLEIKEKELYLSYVDIYNNKIKHISSFIEDIKDTINIIQIDGKDLE